MCVCIYCIYKILKCTPGEFIFLFIPLARNNVVILDFDGGGGGGMYPHNIIIIYYSLRVSRFDLLSTWQRDGDDYEPSV